MKNQTAYCALIVLAVVVSGLMAAYNLVGKEPFAVTVSYVLPEIRQEEEPAQESAPLTAEDVELPINLNTATLEELTVVPRVGEVTANNILEYREEIGGFTGVEQLLEISGIGGKTYETIAPYFYVEDA